MSAIKQAIHEILDAQDGKAMEKLQALQDELTKQESTGSPEAHYGLIYLSGILETPAALLADLSAISTR